MLVLALPLAAVEVPDTAPDVVKVAHWLVGQGRFEEAHEVTSTWLRDHPNDGPVLFEQAFDQTVAASAQSDKAVATTMRREAFQDAKRAHTLAPDPVLFEVITRATDETGADLCDPARLPGVPAVADELRKGELAFGKHELDTALACYQRALELDPRSWHAALFIGDVHFVRRAYADAITWFQKAIAIDPNQETAHRYLADTYARLGKNQEALNCYIDAVVAQPYSEVPRGMLARYALHPGQKFGMPKMNLPRANVRMGSKGPELAYNPEDGPLGMAYTVGRAGFFTQDAAKHFPKGWKPRHSVYEECAGLRLFVGTARDLGEKEPTVAKLQPTIDALQSLDQAGLLEAFVLLDRADEGIAQDYPAYRQMHRAELVRYIRQVWLKDALATPKPVPPAKSDGKTG